MNTYTPQFYDLLSRALGASDSAHLQGFLDEVMAEKYNALQLDGFSFNPDMQLDFTYEQIQAEIGLNVMASYVDVDSPAIPIGTEGPQLSTGRIPRMKMVEYLNEDKIRKMLIAEQRFGAASDRVRQSAVSNLFVTLDRLIGGHTNSLTYQRHQMVSAGKLTLTDVNNPNGITDVTFSAKVPKENVTTLSGTNRWWTSVSEGTYSSEGTSCNPVADLKKIVRTARNRGVRGHFEVETTFMDQVLGHSKILSAIAAQVLPLADATVGSAYVANMADSAKDAALAAIVGAPFVRMDSIVTTQKWDKTQKRLTSQTFNAFDGNVLVFVPDGSLGEVLTVEPITVQGGVYGGFYDGRLLLTVGVDPVKKCQSYNTEMTSLVVPDKPQYLWYIHPYAAS